MFFAATALEAFWDKQDELLFAGPWCLPYGRRLDPAARFRFLPDPWETLDARRKAYQECAAAYQTLMPALAERFNAVHGTSFSTRYWTILAGPWLVRYIQLMRDRYELVRSARERHSDLRTWTLSSSSRILVKDAAEFTALCCADGYNLQLFSQLCEALGVAAQPRALNLARLSASGGGFSARLRRGVKRGAELVRRATRRPVWLHELCLPPRDVAKLVLLSKGKAWPFHAPAAAIAAPRFADAALRGHFGGLPSGDAFTNVLAATLPLNVPWLYVEGYAKLAKLARRRAGRVPRVVVSANGWAYDEAFKAVAAAQAEKGARLIGIQHGGGYGMYECIWQEQFERSIVDAFWCWGWSDLDGDARLKNIPAPLLSRLPAPAPGGTEILVVSTDQSVYRHGFHSQPLGWQFHQYLRDREAFLAALPPELRRRAAVRLQPGDYGWRQADRLRAACPEVAIDRGERPFTERLKRCRVAVFDHPGTSFLECVAAGVPTVSFWRPEQWKMRPETERIFDRLRRIGALFESPEAAASALAARAEGLEDWWRAPEVSDAFDEVRSYFARSSSNWTAPWLAALRLEEEKAHR